METRCLTVCAPFAHLITTGAKLIENRSRPTRFRGRLLIHAGVRRSYGGHSADYWSRLFDVEPSSLTYGAFVGVVDLVDCLPVASVLHHTLQASPLPVSPHAIGPWCWILAHPRRLVEPVPARGNLGLFRVDPFTLARVSSLVNSAVSEVLSC